MPTDSVDPSSFAALPPLVTVADALAAFAEPALVVDTAGRVVAANAAAAELAVAIQSGFGPDVVRMVRDRRAATGMVALPAQAAPKQFECTVLPVESERALVLAKDVTFERSLRTALFESRQRYKDLVEISSDFAWELGANGRFVFVSPRGALGYPADALIGRVPADFLVVQADSELPSPFLAEHAVEGAEIWMRCADGSLACLIAAAAPLRGPAGEWRGARGVCRDVTHARARDAALARASNRERLLTYIVRAIRDVVDPADMLAAAAEATARAVGARGCQIMRTGGARDALAVAAQHGGAGDPANVAAALARDDHYEAHDGERVLAAITAHGRGVNGAVCLWRGMDQLAWSDDDRLLCDSVATQIGIAIEQIANHERILMLSRTDALTGLFNRRAFFEELERRYQRLAHDGRFAALIYCDLDNFKLVNDAYGHAKGDEALIEVRDILVRNTRPVDLVARLGGDEFAVWLEGADQGTAVDRCNALLTAAKALERYSGDPSQPLHVSLGLAVHDPQRPESLEALVARADLAMYQAKRVGKGGWALAAPADRQEPRP